MLGVQEHVWVVGKIGHSQRSVHHISSSALNLQKPLGLLASERFISHFLWASLSFPLISSAYQHHVYWLYNTHHIYIRHFSKSFANTNLISMGNLWGLYFYLHFKRRKLKHKGLNNTPTIMQLLSERVKIPNQAGRQASASYLNCIIYWILLSLFKGIASIIIIKILSYSQVWQTTSHGPNLVHSLCVLFFFTAHQLIRFLQMNICTCFDDDND